MLRFRRTGLVMKGFSNAVPDHQMLGFVTFVTLPRVLGDPWRNLGMTELFRLPHLNVGVKKVEYPDLRPGITLF
jgi:hypothetical protein